MENNTPHNASTYDASSITVLEGLEAVRRRPGMYIGDTGVRGVHHLVKEIIDNSVDEALAGYCRNIVVRLLPGEFAEVEDDGRGIPVDTHPDTGISALQVVLTTLHAGGKFGGGGYKVSGGLHGVGSSVVNALSESFCATVRRNGYEWTQCYERGVPVTPLEQGIECSGTGTTIRFRPDPEIFHEFERFDMDLLRRRLEETARLVPGLVLVAEDHRGDAPVVRRYAYDDGTAGYVKSLSGGGMLFEPFRTTGERDGVMADIAFTMTDSYTERVFGYANLIITPDGGTHLQGFRTGFTRAVNEAARKAGLLKDKDGNLSGEDLKEGLTAVVTVRIEDPQFEGQTKGKLGNASVATAVSSMVYESLLGQFEERDKDLKSLVNKALVSRRAREAARKARDAVRKANGNGVHLDLPGKLAECTSRDPRERELFIVEGDSAGGSAKQGRDRHFQAVLPLRGKILNCERVSIATAMENREIESLVRALGCGIGDGYDETKLRYHNVFIMTDADVDGSHIRTLLLAFFFRMLPGLLRSGKIHAAQPPLYGVRFSGRKNEMKYLYSDEELRHFLGKLGDGGGKASVQRYKGLGEMSAEQLWETTMDPARRVVKRFSVEDAVAAEEMLVTCLGKDVERRRAFIEEGALLARLDV